MGLKAFNQGHEKLILVKVSISAEKVVYMLIHLYFLAWIICTTSKNIKSLTNQHSRIEIKQKILSEIKKGSEKERIFSDEERDTLSKFLKKIVTELDLKSSN